MMRASRPGVVALITVMLGILVVLGGRPSSANTDTVVRIEGTPQQGWVELSEATVHAAVRAGGGDPAGLPDRHLSEGDRVVLAVDGARVEPGGAGLVLSGRLDPNTATAAQLQALPGIGPSLSARILEERGRGAFLDVQDLQRVKGIGPKTVERLAPLVEIR
jgi:competence ComEA-like helix-hairpin-helix protein